MTKRIIMIKGIIALITIGCLLTSCSGLDKSEDLYYSSAKDAFENESSFDILQGGLKSIREEIGVYKVNEKYSLYFVLLDNKTNNQVVNTVVSVMLLETKDNKFSYTGKNNEFTPDFLNFEPNDEAKIASSTFEAEGKQIDYYFAVKELLNAQSFSEDYVIYDGVINLKGKSFDISIAILRPKVESNDESVN